MSAFYIWLSISVMATLVAGGILGFKDASRGTAVPLEKKAKRAVISLAGVWYMGMLAMYSIWTADKLNASLSCVTWAAISLLATFALLRYWQSHCATLFRFLIWYASN